MQPSSLFRVSVTYGLLVGLVIVSLAGSLGLALAAAAITAATVPLGALLTRRLLPPYFRKPQPLRKGPR
ncbi:hypothetical protein [Streptomyces cinereoruber]|uniref:hypothetical protein n=1 Tax=Streptomyces cinereoruber TaxID=67260 RepID=UPI0036251F19